MAYNTVYVWTAYETLTAASLNNNDANLDYLKSKADRHTMMINAVAPTTSLSVANGVKYFYVTEDLNGYDLVLAEAAVYTASSSGQVAVRIWNDTDGVNMLSTLITIDQNETTSYSAATPGVINTSTDDIATGDRIRIDVTQIGTGSQGLDVHLSFLLP